MVKRVKSSLEKRLLTISIKAIAEKQGLSLRQSGDAYSLCCPFHQDKKFSLNITPENTFHCGACGEKGNVIDWVILTQGVSYRHAVEILKADVPIRDQSKLIKKATVPVLDLVFKAGDKDRLLKQIIDFYHSTLLDSSDAFEYLESRGLNDPELINTFKLGYANRSLTYRLPHKNRQKGEEIRTQLQEIGILRKSGHEHFNGSLVVPVWDSNGKIIEIYGRKILGSRLRKGTPMHTYLPGPHTGVWNLDKLSNSTEVIICESLIDAMTYWVNGYRQVTACFGPDGFTEDMLATFKKLKFTKVYIAFRRNDAGDAGAEKLAARLIRHGMDCYRVLLPKNMGVNTYACEISDARKQLGITLKRAEWLGKGKTSGNRREHIPERGAENNPGGEVVVAATDIKQGDLLALEDIPVEINEQDVSIQFENRLYRIRGIDKNPSYEQLRINLLVRLSAKDFEVSPALKGIYSTYFVDNLDLYSAKQRFAYIRQAAFELRVDENVIKLDIGRLLLRLEAMQEQTIQEKKEKANSVPRMSEAELKAARAFLESPRLIERVLEDFEQSGLVGETDNLLFAYLATSSRKLERPLSVIVQSSSAAGKSALMDKVMSFMPPEECVEYSAMTGQSLYYMQHESLSHKILAISEEQGLRQAHYALKLLQSEGVIRIASTGKNVSTGRLETQEYVVEGPIMFFCTTTAIDIDEELMNRCVVLSVDESLEQTEAIQIAQREKRTLKGIKASRDKDAIQTLHQNAQRLLRPLLVVNPFATQLDFSNNKTRHRRDHEKYLNLIESIALLHQFQRELKTDTMGDQVIEYIEVAPSDIDLANKLASSVFAKGMSDLPPQTRALLDIIQENHGKERRRFQRKEIRVSSPFSDGLLKHHLQRLVELEYLSVHRNREMNCKEYQLLSTDVHESLQFAGSRVE